MGAYGKTGRGVPQERGIEKHISSMRDMGCSKDFDCLVGVSGGRDSSYLLYLLTTRHNLRCVAAYYRTPFTPREIDQNVRRLTRDLKVPLVEMNISQDYHRSIASQVVLTWLKTPDPVIANLACAPCKLVNREVFRIAKEHGVRSVVFGGNKLETFQLGAGQFRDYTASKVEDSQPQHSFGRQSRKTMLLLRRGIGTLMAHPTLLRHLTLGFQASVLYINPHTPYLRLCYPQTHRIDYFHHTEWNEDEANAVLDQIGWELPKNSLSRWRSDCIFGEMKNYMFSRMTGVTYMDAYLSNMVRAGIIDRNVALRRLQTEGKFCEARFIEVCEALQLSPDLFPR
jgi:hypothetical protein